MPNSGLLVLLGLLLLPQVYAFGAGNIASISAVEGKNWRHGDIEDVLKTIAFIKGHKWTSIMIKRVYFGNWLRDYSQAMDVGTLKSLPADTIRIIVWVLSFLTFGFATGEFEVTADRLGTYRPEEHIDNPKDYADNQDARQTDARLRGPVRQVELDIDLETGMKNYIANERGDWDTSSRYVKYSLARSIHYGRQYASSHREEDLAEALRCLGQGLHTLEDFAAHTNYCELALREMGFLNVFPHTGVNTQINLHGRHVFPLVTGTFGMVDFFHSVLGEATDHFTQSEVNEMDVALGDAQANSSSGSLGALTGLLGKIPGTRELVVEAEDLKQRSEAQETSNRSLGSQSGYATTRADSDGKPSSGGVLSNFDPNKTISQIYPILAFRDKVVRKLTSIIEKIPGLEAAVEKISETLTIFVMSLLAPFIRPIISAASSSLQTGSAGVIDASGKHQYEPWTDPTCTDPTHSLLSKDHFANILNEPAGHVASAIVRYVAPRVLYAWEHPGVSETEVTADCLRVFHHPAIRDMHNEAHRTMFEAVGNWLRASPDRASSINDVLSSQGVREGKNTGGVPHTHKPAGFSALGSNAHGDYHQQHQQHQAQHGFGGFGFGQGQSHGQGHSQGQGQGLASSIPWDQLNKLPIPGISKLSNFIPGGLTREAEPSQPKFHYTDHSLGGGASGGHSSDYYHGQGGQSHHNPYGYGHGHGHGQY